MRVPVFVCLVAGLPASLQATDLLVPEEYSTLSAAIGSAQDGDRILVGPGTYTGPGNRDLSFGGREIVMLGVAGPAQTVLDCGALGRALSFLNGETSAAVLDGFRIERGRHASDDLGGAILVNNASPTIRNCEFFHCQARHGGAIRLLGSGVPLVESCLFQENYAIGSAWPNTASGGAISVASNSGLHVAGSVFLGNYSSGGGHSGNDSEGAAIYLDALANARIEDCEFRDNYNDFANQVYVGGAAEIYRCFFIGGWGSIWAQGSLVVENCTFVNDAISFGLESGGHVRSSIFTVTGIQCWDPAPAVDVSCCAFWNVQYPAFCLGEIIDQDGNFAADPMFCDPYGGDYRLDATSPCLPGGGGECGLIGAYGQGCGTVAIAPKSWGRVKELFRSKEP